ncbi:MAG: hypothetical protein ACRECW_18715 [Phyllobacterium sp.]
MTKRRWWLVSQTKITEILSLSTPALLVISFLPIVMAGPDPAIHA